MKNKFLLYFAVISLLFISCNVVTKITQEKNVYIYNPVVAHRGAWKKNNLPQNSIASLKQSIKLKCAGSEFDVRMTADNVLIIHHDPNYNKLSIEKTSYAELESFLLSNGEKLPTFQEYILAGINNNTSTKLVCEIKPSGISPERGIEIAEKVVTLVQKIKAQSYVMYISFDYGILKKIMELNPKAITQYLGGDKSPEQLKADRISGADYYFSVFKKHPEWIESAKKMNIYLNAWTVNETGDMDWLISNGFDFITTNEPELLLEKTLKNQTIVNSESK